MKIAAIQNLYRNVKAYISKTGNVTDVKSLAASENLSLSNGDSFVLQSDFSHKPVSSKIPNYEPLNCDYGNVNEFSKKFSQKIDSQLMTIEKKDVENLISRIQLRTKADPKTVCSILYKLSIVSSGATLKILNSACERFGSNNFDLESLSDSNFIDYSLNSALNYLAQNKNMIKSDKKSDKYVFVLDDTFLKQVEKSKRENGDLYKNLQTLYKENRLIFLSLPGWDVKCSDNKYRSANFLLGKSMLEDLACDMVKRVQKGEKPEDILYSDFEKRTKNLFGDKKKLIWRCVFQEKSSPNVNDVLYNLKEQVLPAKIIKSRLNSAVDFIKKQTKREKVSSMQELLCKFLDDSTIVYSNDSMALELINLKKQITQKYGNDVRYIVPESNKSYGYITSIYAKLNDLDMTKQNQNAKNAVILDDISVSGDSLASVAKESDEKVSFAYILATPFSLGFSWLGKKPENVKDIFYARKIKDMSSENYADFNLLSKEDLSEIKKRFCCSFANLHLSCAFPHIIPDNVGNFSAVMFNDLLMADSKEANKAIYEINNLNFKKDEKGRNLAYKHNILCNGKYCLFLNSDNSRVDLFFKDGKIERAEKYDSKGNPVYIKDYLEPENGVSGVKVYYPGKPVHKTYFFEENSYSGMNVDEKSMTMIEFANYKKEKDGTVVGQRLLSDGKVQKKTYTPSKNKTETEFFDYSPQKQIYDDSVIITI